MANAKGHRRFGNIRKLSSGRYQARYQGPDGFMRTAPHTFTTEKLAAKWLTLTEADILKGEWTPPEAGEVTLGPYAERWIRERKLAPRTREIYESIYKLNIGAYLGGLPLGEIKPATIRAWRKKLLDDGRPEIQAVKAYRVLRAIFNTAVKEDEILKANPCRIPGYDDQPSSERPVATLKQLQDLGEAMPARYYALIMLAAYSGLRWGELVALRRGDVDLDGKAVRVERKLIEVRGKLEFGPPKSAAGKRTVPLPLTAMQILRDHLKLNVDGDEDALLFVGEKGAPLRASNFRRAVRWTQACREAALPKGFHFHDTRHFGNLLASEAGASTKELMHRLGHSTMQAALRYQHSTDRRARQIADEMDRHITKQGNSNHDDDDGSSGVLVPVG